MSWVLNLLVPGQVACNCSQPSHSINFVFPFHMLLVQIRTAEKMYYCRENSKFHFMCLMSGQFNVESVPSQDCASAYCLCFDFERHMMKLTDYV